MKSLLSILATCCLFACSGARDEVMSQRDSSQLSLLDVLVKSMLTVKYNPTKNSCFTVFEDSIVAGKYCLYADDGFNEVFSKRKGVK